MLSNVTRAPIEWNIIIKLGLNGSGPEPYEMLVYGVKKTAEVNFLISTRRLYIGLKNQKMQ